MPPAPIRRAAAAGALPMMGRKSSVNAAENANRPAGFVAAARRSL